MSFPDFGALFRAWQDSCPRGTELSITISLKPPRAPDGEPPREPGAPSPAGAGETAAVDRAAEPPHQRRRVEPAHVSVAAPQHTASSAPTTATPLPPRTVTRSAAPPVAAFVVQTYHREPSSTAVFIVRRGDGTSVRLQSLARHAIDWSAVDVIERTDGTLMAVCASTTFAALTRFLESKRAVKIKAERDLAVSWRSALAATVRLSWQRSSAPPSLGITDRGSLIVAGDVAAVVFRGRPFPELSGLAHSTYFFPAQSSSLPDEDLVLLSKDPSEPAPALMKFFWSWTPNTRAVTVGKRALEPLMDRDHKHRLSLEHVFSYTHLFSLPPVDSARVGHASFIHQTNRAPETAYILSLPHFGSGTRDGERYSLLQAVEIELSESDDVPGVGEVVLALSRQERFSVLEQPWVRLSRQQGLLLEHLARHAQQQGMAFGVREDAENRALCFAGHKDGKVSFVCLLENCSVEKPIGPQLDTSSPPPSSICDSISPQFAAPRPALLAPREAGTKSRKRRRDGAKAVVVRQFQDDAADAVGGVLFTVSTKGGEPLRISTLVQELQPVVRTGPSSRRKKSSAEQGLLRAVSADDGNRFFVATRPLFEKVLSRLQKDVGSAGVQVEEAEAGTRVRVLCLSLLSRIIAALTGKDTPPLLFGISSRASIVITTLSLSIVVAASECSELSLMLPCRFAPPAALSAAADLTKSVESSAVVVHARAMPRGGQPLPFAWTPFSSSAVDEDQVRSAGPFVIGGSVPAAVGAVLLEYTDLFIEKPALRRGRDGQTLQNDAIGHCFHYREDARKVFDSSTNCCLVFLPTPRSRSDHSPQLCCGVFCESDRVKKMVHQLSPARLRTVSRGEGDCIERQRVLLIGYDAGRALEQVIKHADKRGMAVAVYEPVDRTAVYFVGRLDGKVVFVCRITEFQLFDSKTNGHGSLWPQNAAADPSQRLEIVDEEEQEDENDDEGGADEGGADDGTTSDASDGAL